MGLWLGPRALSARVLWLEAALMLERSVAGRKASVRINGRNGMSHDNVFAEFDDSRQTDTVERTTVPAAP